MLFNRLKLYRRIKGGIWKRQPFTYAGWVQVNWLPEYFTNTYEDYRK